jgi:hypothetical protein
VTQEAVATIRLRADLARRLAGETRDPTAKAGLLQIASRLQREADTLDAAAPQQPSASGDE